MATTTDSATPPADTPRRGRRERIRSKPGLGQAYRGAVFLAGLAFIALGLALAILPGPLTIPPVLLGLWIWSTEFAWADRQLDRATASARVAWDDAKRRPVLSGMVTGGGLVVLGVAVWLVARYEVVGLAREVVGL